MDNKALPLSQPVTQHSPPRVLRQPQRRTWTNRCIGAVRWLHIYLSLLGFTALMFFAVTGITLNHPTWFGGDVHRVSNHQGTVDQRWLHRTSLRQDDSKTSDSETDDGRDVDQLAIVEYLRAQHGFRGAVSEFRTDESECVILFKGPAYSVDVFVNRASGHYSATQTSLGSLAFINDLHKGRDSGPIWSVVIDAIAVLMILISITGLALIFFLRRKRVSGIATAVVGTVIFCALVWAWSP